MKSPWLIAIRCTPQVLEARNQPANAVEVFEPLQWWTSFIGDDIYFLMKFDHGFSIRWKFEFIDQLTITRRTEGEQK